MEKEKRMLKGGVMTKNYETKNSQSIRQKLIDFIMFVWLWAAVGGADSMESLPFVLFITPPLIWLWRVAKRSDKR